MTAAACILALVVFALVTSWTSSSIRARQLAAHQSRVWNLKERGQWAEADIADAVFFKLSNDALFAVAERTIKLFEEQGNAAAAKAYFERLREHVLLRGKPSDIDLFDRIVMSSVVR